MKISQQINCHNNYYKKALEINVDVMTLRFILKNVVSGCRRLVLAFCVIAYSELFLKILKKRKATCTKIATF